MSVVEDSLVIVGNDTIKNLYDFVSDRQRRAQESDNFVDWLMYTRILVELSLAITSYTGRKDKSNGRKDKTDSDELEKS